MRRLFALMLIATSAWLLHQTVSHHLGGVGPYFWTELGRQSDNLEFIVPAVGGVLCVLGGLTVFFNGPGGALLALLGGLAVAAFASTLNQTFRLEHFWDNELAVGVVLLMLASFAASMSRT